ncbi:MAG: hypothetical protein ABFS34_05690 [Gemmatimonadota bacterium]
MPVVVLKIERAFRHPTRFKNVAFIRVGSYKKKLKDHPQLEGQLWRQFDEAPFEVGVASEPLDPSEVIQLLDSDAYFELLGLPVPEGPAQIAPALQRDALIAPDSGRWRITSLGGVLFAKDLSAFPTLRRKAVRVIEYKGRSRVNAIREYVAPGGYAAGFEDLMVR